MSQLNLVVWRPQARRLTHTRKGYHEQISHSAHARFIIELRVTQCKTEIKHSPTKDQNQSVETLLNQHASVRVGLCAAAVLSCFFRPGRKSVQTPALTVSMNMHDQRADSVSTASACNFVGTQSSGRLTPIPRTIPNCFRASKGTVPNNSKLLQPADFGCMCSVIESLHFSRR